MSSSPSIAVEKSQNHALSRSQIDWLFVATFILIVVIACTQFATKLRHLMDAYEIGILIFTPVVLGWIAYYWPRFAQYGLVTAVFSGLAVHLYGGQLATGQSQFLLKYFLGSQMAILWMSILFAFALIFYWAGNFSRSKSTRNLWTQIGSRFSMAAVCMGSIAMLVRWHESYLKGADYGRVPISNLYEVFVLFCIISALFYLYYEDRYRTKSLGGFIHLIICSAIGFLMWYALSRQGQTIEPLLPALKSWWMKLHVPANFIGYGTFSIASMVAFAYLIKSIGLLSNRQAIVPIVSLLILGTLIGAEPLIFRKNAQAYYWPIYFAVAATIVGLILLFRKRVARSLPPFEVMDDIMYKSIAVGFAFFTVATILGAMWAAEAWGGYWSWDPKETWALIVWLNYAAWLHLRLMRTINRRTAAWWALIGLIVTSYAFLGVNMQGIGLHSYGSL